MTINKFQWQQIVGQAQSLGIPALKKRGILREFLQTVIVSNLYNSKESRKIVFCGGTALRLLYGNKRLSEDLDFDLIGKNIKLKNLLEKLYYSQKKEIDEIEFKSKSGDEGLTAYFKYPKILFNLGISSNKNEKLKIKLDFSYAQDKIAPQTKVLSRFGYLQTVLTYDLSTLLSQKIRALFTRAQAKGRDLYDIANLLSQNIVPNFNLIFLREKDIKNLSDFYKFLSNFLAKNKRKIPYFKKQIEPFLIDEKELRYLEILPQLVKEKSGNSK